MRKIIVGITGASGVIYGIRLLEVLQKNKEIETNLILSNCGAENILLETKKTVAAVKKLADVVYDIQDMAASLASGSFKTDGMIIMPATVKTLSAIANSYDDNLLIRAADCTLKERRKLVTVFRETPLHQGHLEIMMKITSLGGIILPPVPAFYHHPQTITDIIDHTVGKVLDQFDIEHDLFARWEGSAKPSVDS